jgi:hypothetical protein
MNETGSTASSQTSWADPNAHKAGAQEVHDTSISNGNDTDFLTRPFSTLDEPIKETIMRDVRSVSAKLKVVLLPLQKSNPLEYVYQTVSADDDAGGIAQGMGEDQKKVLSTLRDWDLWGPLVVCLTLSILLSIRAPSSQTSAVFAAVFMSMWFGSAIVTINAKLLGGTISFFQSVCVLGYCVFPFCLSALMILVLGKTPLGMVWIDLIWVAVGFVWATRASTVFIAQFIQKERRFLAVFPVFFYYILLGWLVLLF